MITAILLTAIVLLGIIYILSGAFKWHNVRNVISVIMASAMAVCIVLILIDTWRIALNIW